jgi:hypothetical protein
MASRCLFSSEDRKISDALGFVFRGCAYHHVLEPTPPLTIQPSVLTMPSVLVMTASGSMMTMLATLTRTGAALMSRIESQEVGHEEAERNRFNAFRGYWWVVFFQFIFFQSFSNLPFLPSAKSQSQDTPDRTPRPKTSMLSFTLSTSSPNGHRRTVLPLQQTPNTPICIGFFELPEALATQALLLPCVQDRAGEGASVK